jgi:rhodanese-related sulfurtransferase
MRIIIIVIAAFLFAACQTAPQQKIDSKADVKPGITEMAPAEARPAVEAAYSQLIDVREPAEYMAGHAYRARNIPLGTLEANLDKLEKNEPVYLICQTDNRSREAARKLADRGFGRLVVITGGTEAWREAGLPMSEGNK